MKKLFSILTLAVATLLIGGCDDFLKPVVVKKPVVEAPAVVPDKPAPNPEASWPTPVVPSEPEGQVEGTVPVEPEVANPMDDPRWHKPVPTQPSQPDEPFRPKYLDPKTE